jgi:hypothetical protein
MRVLFCDFAYLTTPRPFIAYANLVAGQLICFLFHTSMCVLSYMSWTVYWPERGRNSLLSDLLFYLLTATFYCPLHDVQPNIYITTIKEYHSSVFLFALPLSIFLIKPISIINTNHCFFFLITHLSDCYHNLPSLLKPYKGQQTNFNCVCVMLPTGMSCKANSSCLIEKSFK